MVSDTCDGQEYPASIVIARDDPSLEDMHANLTTATYHAAACWPMGTNCASYTVNQPRQPVTRLSGVSLVMATLPLGFPHWGSPAFCRLCAPGDTLHCV